MKNVWKKFKIKGIALKIFAPVTAMIIVLCVVFMVLVNIGLSKISLINQEKSLKGQSNFVLSYMDKVYEGDWAVTEGKLYKGNQLISGNTELVDLISNKTGYFCTFFLSDVRTSTSVTVNGKRVTGTKASDVVIHKVLKEGLNYLGYANVVGTRTLSFYTPVKDAHGNIIGMFFLGNEQKSVDSLINQTVASLIFVMVIALVLGIFITLAISFNLSSKIIDTLEMIEDLSVGKLGRRLKIKSKDEIGKMSAAMNGLADQLQTITEKMNTISQGDISVEITERSADDMLYISIKKVIATINNLSSEVKNLILSARSGDFTVRGESSKFKGQYSEMVEGINELLDVITKAYKNMQEANRVAEKQALYQKAEVQKVVINLEKLAQGDLNCDMTVADADDETKELYETFCSISDNLHKSIDSIKNYIKEVSNVLGQMANGNFNTEITDDFKGDFVDIKNSINNIAVTLSGLIGKIESASGQVSSGSYRLLQSSQALSQGVTEQAGAIEELSTAISDIASQTKQNAANAEQAKDLAEKAKSNANTGNDQMQHMMQSMKDINIASVNISNIVKVIDSIAFQTNMLALNAAVEAARAGQYGKGFAVVAEEVRNLAARCAEAVKDTTSLITDSLQKVEAGTKTTDETAKSLSKIMSVVDTMANLVTSISSASNNQATGIAQIYSGLEQVSAVVKTNAEAAEQSSASSMELSHQADLLKLQVNKFKIQEDAGNMHSLNNANEVALLQLASTK